MAASALASRPSACAWPQSIKAAAVAVACLRRVERALAHADRWRTQRAVAAGEQTNRSYQSMMHPRIQFG